MFDLPAGKNPMARHLTIPLTAASVQVLGPNPRRLALLLSSSSTLAYFVAFGEPVTVDNGIHIPAGFPPHTFLTRAMFGDLICGAVFVLSTAGGNVGMVEVLTQ